MPELESAIFALLDPYSPAVAPLGDERLRALAGQLAEAAREAVAGVLEPGECDAEMRRILRGSGYPRHLAAPAARRLVEHVA